MNTQTVNIIPVTTDDVETLAALSRETFSETFAHTTTAQDLQLHLETAYARDKLLQELANPESEFYFAVVDGRIEGYVKVNWGQAQSEPMPATHAEVERLYLRRSAKRKGIGTALMQFAVTRALQQGKTVLWLGVWEHNEPAKAFYAACGFEKFGEHAYPIGNDPQTDWLLAKPLDLQHLPDLPSR